MRLRDVLRRIERAIYGCPREGLGYRCHADHPGGCEACGLVLPVRPDLAEREAPVPAQRRR